MDMGTPHQVRNEQPQYDNTGAPQQPPQQGGQPPRRRWYQPTLESKIIVILVMLAALAVLGAFVAGMFTQKSNGEEDFVNQNQYQAVFLGEQAQPYFGNITQIDDDLIVLEDIYYLQVDRQVQPGQQRDTQNQDPQVSLAKLGQELHGPEDKMFISADKVIYWENLKRDGQVTQAIERDKQSRQNGGGSEVNNGPASNGQSVPQQPSGSQPQQETQSSDGTEGDNEN